jgi:rhamnogalacturonan II specific xylosyltransferase
MIFLWPTEGAKLLLRKWIEEMKAQPWSKQQKSNDQPAFNWALNKTAGQVCFCKASSLEMPLEGENFSKCILCLTSFEFEWTI